MDAGHIFLSMDRKLPLAGQNPQGTTKKHQTLHQLHQQFAITVHHTDAVRRVAV